MEIHDRAEVHYQKSWAYGMKRTDLIGYLLERRKCGFSKSELASFIMICGLDSEHSYGGDTGETRDS